MLDRWEVQVLADRINDLWGRRDRRSQQELKAYIAVAMVHGLRYVPPSWWRGGGYLIAER